MLIQFIPWWIQVRCPACVNNSLYTPSVLFGASSQILRQDPGTMCCSWEALPLKGACTSRNTQGILLPECSTSSPWAAPHPHLTPLLVKAGDEQLKAYWNLFQLFLPWLRTQLGNPELLPWVRRCFTLTETGWRPSPAQCEFSPPTEQSLQVTRSALTALKGITTKKEGATRQNIKSWYQSMITAAGNLRWYNTKKYKERKLEQRKHRAVDALRFGASTAHVNEPTANME